MLEILANDNTFIIHHIDALLDLLLWVKYNVHTYVDKYFVE